MKRKQLLLMTTTLSSSLLISTSFAAQLVDVSKQPANMLKSYLATNQLTRLSEHTDFNGTQHTRFQQTYLGYPVFAADIVVHTPKSRSATTMNGFLYQQLYKDLVEAPTDVFHDAQAQNALRYARVLYQAQTPMASLQSNDNESQALVYVDKQSIGHWAYKIAFTSKLENDMVARPSFIVDAKTLAVYEQWDNIQTANGGGFGGNPRIGQLTYDGGTGNLPVLGVTKTGSTCYAKNTLVSIVNLKTNTTSSYPCKIVDPIHNNTYWNGSLDQVNGGFSPSNDALHGMKMVSKLYTSWYKVPVLTQNGKPMLLVGRVHANMDNAYWDGKQMTFGDGINYFYPLTSLDVMGHEISHGFTQQHSGLIYRYQSGGLNEAFSDMAGEATKFYATGKNDFVVGSGIMKHCNNPNFCGLRSMSDPRIDGRSIDHLSQYKDGIDVHYSSGIYNKVFYLIANTKGWGTKKAFNVMTKANMDYWTSNTTFVAAGCGVVKAATDYKYNLTAVKNALDKVGIATTSC